MTPVKDLKLLVKDYAPIAKNALTILINITHDGEVQKNLAKDDEFLETLLLRITVCQFPAITRNARGFEEDEPDGALVQV